MNIFTRWRKLREIARPMATRRGNATERLRARTVLDPCPSCGVARDDGYCEHCDYDPTPYCIGCGAMTKAACIKNGCPDPFYCDNH